MVSWELVQNELGLESDTFIQKTFIECLLYTSICTYTWGMKRRLWEITYRLRDEKFTTKCNLKYNKSTYKNLSLFIKNKTLTIRKWTLIPFERDQNIWNAYKYNFKICAILIYLKVWNIAERNQRRLNKGRDMPCSWVGRHSC